MEAGEILNINNEYATYRDYKAAVDAELRKSAESFVRIGYLLKVARDTDILKDSEYGNVNDFAWKEYKLDRSQVSRFIRINDEFSEGGYSEVLQERYRGIGYAKLAIMLTLPEAINEELTDAFSKSEIQTIKEEVEAEKAITDLEVMMESKNEEQEGLGIFAKVLHQLGHDEPELYLKMYEAVEDTVYDGNNAPVVKKLMDALAPAGEAIHTVRVPGEGRKMLSIKGENVEPVIVDIRSNERISCTWDNFIIDMEYLCDGENAKSSWEKLYGEAFPIKEEPKKAPVAPVQQNKPSKVTKAKVNSNAEKPRKPEKTTTERKSENNITSAVYASAGSSPERDAGEDAGDKQSAAGVSGSTFTDGEGEHVSEENAGAEEAAEQGSDGDDGREKEELSSLLRKADMVSGEVYDCCMDALEEPEDITLEELQEIKKKLSELSLIVEQLIALKGGE